MIGQEIFDNEMKMCRELYNKNSGCAWGECEKCGVIPLLHKIVKGEIIEEKQDIIRLKNKYLK